MAETLTITRGDYTLLFTDESGRLDESIKIS